MKDILSAKYKTLILVAKIVEVVGWLICLTLVLIPMGLAMVLYSQAILVQVSTEKNTRRSAEALEKIAVAVAGGKGLSVALQEVGSGSEDICSKCGEEMEDGEKFCGTCGAQAV